MKKQFTIFLLLAFFGLNSVLKAQIPINGLVAYWPFNGNANDESGNGNNGTVYGATLTTDRFDNANSAYSFNGTNDYINCGHGSSLSQVSNELSVSLWINSSSVISSDKFIIGKANPTKLGYEYAMAFGSVYNGFVAIAGGDPLNDYIPTNFLPIQGNWYHLVMTWKYPGYLVIYKDGVKMDSLATATGPIEWTDQDLVIGCLRNNPVDYVFNGKIDNISIYNRALTQSEITALYNDNGVCVSFITPAFTQQGPYLLGSGSVTLPTTSNNGISGAWNPPIVNTATIGTTVHTFTPDTGQCALQTTMMVTVVYASGLVAYWPFNGNANDESGYINNGTVNGAALTTDRFGNANSAYSFDGSNDYVNCGHGSSLSQVSNEISISLWINSSSVISSDKFIIGKANPTKLGYEYAMAFGSVYNGFVAIAGGDPLNDYIPTNFLPIQGNWYHLVMTWKYPGYLVIYKDGVKMDSLATATGPIEWTDQDLVLGCLRNNPVDYVFNGKIDDISIYNRAISQTEITALYGEGGWSSLKQGLVAEYPFNGNANDESGNGNHGTVNGATLTTDRFGNTNCAYSFDGTNDYIDCGQGSSLQITNDITVCAWIKTATITDNLIVVNKYYGGYGWLVETRNDGIIGFDGRDPDWHMSLSAVEIDDNLWHFIVGQREGSIWKIYIDGALSNQIDVGTSGSINSNLSDLVIGSNSNAYTCCFFNGVIDDIRIYNRALSQTEITALYNECSGSFIGQTATPTGTSLLFMDPPNTVYTIARATNATSYIWHISPSNAGTITGTDTTATVDWDSTFSGTAIISVKGQNYCGDGDSAILTVIIDSAYKTLQLKLYIEGFYTGNGQMHPAMDTSGSHFEAGVADLVTIELHYAAYPFGLAYTFSDVPLHTDGSLYVNEILQSLSGSYFVVIKHRNSMETWSKLPVNCSGTDTITYDFTISDAQAFGDNLKLTGDMYSVFSGDAYQDGVVDASDMAMVDNGNTPPILIGYNTEDVNGDGVVDGSDMAIVDNNSKPPPVQVRRPTKSYDIEKVSGDNQSGNFLQPLTEPIKVQVKDQNGFPYSLGALVHFTANNGGSVSQTDVTTGTDGTASVIWTLSNSCGTQTLTVDAFQNDSMTPLQGSGLEFTAYATTTDIDGNVYNTVQIGSQCWLKENLKVTHYRNGDTIPNVTDNITWSGLSTGAYCDYSNTPSNSIIYGRLYNWYTVGDSRNMAPVGWHVPSDAEWTTLTNYLGGESVAGGKLKETGTTHWQSPNTGATNETGFTAIPGGGRNYDGSFYIKGSQGFWWSSNQGMYSSMYYNYNFVYFGYYYMENGMSVRCVRGDIPIINTNNVTGQTSNSAASGGNITSDGGASVTARGVCWSTTQNPLVTGNHTSDGSGMGSFTSNITGLNANTTYYLRAYATNSMGTAYGNEISFTTQAFVCGTSTVTDLDGNIYNTVQIGNQCWLKENLKTTHYRNGDTILYVTDNTTWSDLTIGAYCDYNNTPTNSETYGRLYNWYTVADSRNIAPVGWHVPTDAEWTILTDYLGGEGVAGGKLKETGTTHWQAPNTGATNETGFTALPSGIRSDNGGFLWNGIYTFWWSNTQQSGSSAWDRDLHFTGSNLNRYYNVFKLGFSVRCVRDCNILSPASGTHIPLPTQIIWTWDSVSGASGYKWNTSNDYNTAEDMGNITTKTETGLTCNSSFTRFVWAYSNCGNSSATTLTQTTSLNPPADPSSGTHVPSPTQIIWNWNTVSGATGYKWNATNNYATAIDMGTGTSKTETGLTCNTAYTRYVWAYNNCGNSSATTLIQTTSFNLPAAPSAGTHVLSPTQIIWNWNTVSGATGYKWNTANNYSTAIDMDTNTSIADTGLTCNTAYSRYVWAYNNCGNSSVTTLIQTTSLNTPAAPPEGTNDLSPTQIIWNWNTVSGATGYKWNTTNNYTTAIDMGTDTSKTETGLTCDTAYTRYVWAYSNCGISSPTTLFEYTSPCPWSCGQPFTDARDGKVYNTVQIGTQCWMAQNLNYGQIINGTDAQTNNCVVEKYCYDNIESNCNVYGGLYKGDEAVLYNSMQGAQGICPSGWHVPTDLEWSLLTNALVDSNVAGVKMKEMGTVHWAPPNYGATNSSGFTGLPGGERTPIGDFQNLTYAGNFWSSTHSAEYFYWTRYLYFSYDKCYRVGQWRESAFSVRCIQGGPPSSAPVAGFTTPGGTSEAFINQSFQFTNTSTGNITSYFWTFGDGGTSTEMNPVHIFTTEDTVIVTLTVSGPGGSDTKCYSIIVRSNWKIKVTNLIDNSGDQPSISVNSNGSPSEQLLYNQTKYFYVNRFVNSTPVLFIWTCINQSCSWNPYVVPDQVGGISYIYEPAWNRSLKLERVE